MANPKPAGSSNNRLLDWANKIAALVVTPPFTNSQLANMTAPAVKARGTAGSGPPEDIGIGNGLTLDATSLRTAQQMSITVDGSGLKLSGDATSPGNSKYYGTDGSGTKGYNSLPAAGGATLLSSASVGTGTTYSVTGLGGYKILAVFFRGVSHNSGASQTFRVALSGNGGSSYGTAFLISNLNFLAAATIFGWIAIDRCDQTNNQCIANGNPQSGVGGEETSSLGPVDALQFSFSAGNFDAGSIDIYGVK